jgi:hypothetical protein
MGQTPCTWNFSCQSFLLESGPSSLHFQTLGNCYLSLDFKTQLGCFVSENHLRNILEGQMLWNLLVP